MHLYVNKSKSLIKTAQISHTFSSFRNNFLLTSDVAQKRITIVSQVSTGHITFTRNSAG